MNPPNPHRFNRLPSPRAHTAVLVVLAAMVVVVSVVWAWFAELDTITRGTGQVIVSSHTQVVQTLDGGILQALDVREGDAVRRGQALARIDSTRVEAAVKESAAKRAALMANSVRLRAEVLGKPLDFPTELQAYPEFVNNQRVLFGKRQAAVNEEVEALKAALSLATQELEMNRKLLATGDVSRADVLRLERQATDLRAQITNRQNKYLQDGQAELARTEEELAGVEQVLAQRREQLNNTRLRAPVDGVIKNVRVTTLGAVLKPGEELLSIVPAGDDLIVETKIRPSDIAYLKTGLPATIKFDAWDYAIYGSFQGRVSYISADTLVEDTRQGEHTYYRVKVVMPSRNLLSQKGTPVDIQPGMTAMVEIRTGSQTVLRYLLKPLVKTLNEAMTER